jgi:hypothetical protein
MNTLPGQDIHPNAQVSKNSEGGMASPPAGGLTHQHFLELASHLLFPRGVSLQTGNHINCLRPWLFTRPICPAPEGCEASE